MFDTKRFWALGITLGAAIVVAVPVVQSGLVSAHATSISIEGSWLITTPSNGGQARAFRTFLPGGALVGSETVNPQGGPGRTTSFHGAWARVGERTFNVTFAALRVNRQGGYAGMVKVRGRITLNAAGDTFSATAIDVITDATGKVIETGKGPVMGTRVKVEPFRGG
jgi:hypothetical protein